ncbi:MAG: hypothetical protein IKK57_12125 [Clostridia bacterium]|nr:hypothetical protein [Clostridia bacterium]
MSETQNNGENQGTTFETIVKQNVFPLLKALGKGLLFLGKAFVNFIIRYFRMGKEKRTVSQSIELVAKVVYWFHLILGFLGALAAWVGAVVYIIDGYATDYFPWNLLNLLALFLGGFVSMLLSKFFGWLSTIFLRAIAVVVASHEKHLQEHPAE